MTPDLLAELIEHTRTGDPNAARQLADIVERAVATPDRRVGAALLPKKRGGESERHAEQRAERNGGYQDYAVAEYGTTRLTPKQAKTLNRKVRRQMAEAHRIEGVVNIGQDTMRRIRAAGLGTVSDRHLLRILNEPEKSYDIHLACLLVIVDGLCRTDESGVTMLSQVVVANDLTLVVGNEAVRLTPIEGFRLAERLIRRSTARMVEEEVCLGSAPAGKRASRTARGAE
jgi:hypothetical protein